MRREVSSEDWRKLVDVLTAASVCRRASLCFHFPSVLFNIGLEAVSVVDASVLEVF